MARVFVTGSAGGLGRAAGAALIDQGHQVVLHARNRDRLADVADLVDRGAATVVGDLANREETRRVAEQVNGLGRMDAVIHNAGVYTGRDILAVNVVAPYMLTALIERPSRLVYLSSGMHRGGRPALRRLDTANGGPISYSDSKLLVTTLAATVARRWTDTLVNAVDPGWVPTRMGGPGATDDLELGHVTQAWLAVSTDPAALTSGGYWYHQQQQPTHRAVQDPQFQDQLIITLEQLTGVALP
ncbi:MAG: SDR family NAD(P)-dependent oxidoreductase [Acidimicrobiaceae bacterium]|nr:SDR family NAD(P)-dependent oxidoreductase [Acidimicrobiaceae bacterium]